MYILLKEIHFLSLLMLYILQDSVSIQIEIKTIH